MTDIVARLRTFYGDDTDNWLDQDEAEPIMLEAADEIEGLREHVNALRLVATSHEPELERLRAALQETVVAIVHVQKHLIHGSPPQDAVMNGALAIARRALEPKP